MKKLALFILTVLSFTIISCTTPEGEDLETDYPMTKSEIIGTWQMEKNAYYYTFTFTNDTYRLEINNAFSNNPQDYPHPFNEDEEGTIKVEGNVITLIPTEGETFYGPLKAYWHDSSKRTINLSPMGTFRRIY